MIFKYSLILLESRSEKECYLKRGKCISCEYIHMGILSCLLLYEIVQTNRIKLVDSKL